jgi:hypothetical protein
MEVEFVEERTKETKRFIFARNTPLNQIKEKARKLFDFHLEDSACLQGHGLRIIFSDVAAEKPTPQKRKKRKSVVVGQHDVKVDADLQKAVESWRVTAPLRRDKQLIFFTKEATSIIEGNGQNLTCPITPSQDELRILGAGRRLASILGG